MEITRESFDNYFNIVNTDLFNGYSKKFVNYLFNEFGDKWNFYIKFSNEKYIPFTLLGTFENIKNLINLPKSNYYIKKNDGSYGRDIIITKNPEIFFKNKNLKKNDYIIQREINSQIYKNKKFDYRIYLLIFKNENKINYGYYKKYVIRNCINNFNDKNNKFSKITNHHIYSLKELDENFYVLNEDFGLNHQDKIEKLNVKVLNKIKEYENDFRDLLNNKQFRILGVDYIVEDKTEKLFLLEINITPGVFYDKVKEDFLIKYNNFHLQIVKDLNDVLYFNENNNFKII